MKTIRNAVIIILLCIIGFIAVIGYESVKLWGTYSDNTTLKELAVATSLLFPPSTKLEHCVNTSFQDSFYYAKFRVRKTDVPAFISLVVSHKAGYKFYLQKSETNRLKITNEMHSEKWWKPDSAHKFYAVRVDRIKKTGYGSETTQAFIVLDEPTWATVYLDYSAD